MLLKSLQAWPIQNTVIVNYGKHWANIEDVHGKFPPETEGMCHLNLVSQVQKPRQYINNLQGM